MSGEVSASSEQAVTPGKRRTWWHPPLVRLLNHLMGPAYEVQDEVLVGRMPLRVDILLIRREQGRLTVAAERDLGALVPLLNRFTLVEFKGFAMQHTETEYLGGMDRRSEDGGARVDSAGRSAPRFVGRGCRAGIRVSVGTMRASRAHLSRRTDCQSVLLGLRPLAALREQELAQLRRLLERKRAD